MKIILDGPAGSGKSSVAKKIAFKLSFLHLDSGKIYRSIGWFLKKNKDLDGFVYSLKEGRHFVNGEDVTDDILTEEFGEWASIVAQKKSVREKSNKCQREIAKGNNVVVDGRDGHLIFPDAELKVYLTASLEERGKRVLKDLSRSGVGLEEVKKSLKERDDRDINRSIDPLYICKDAVVLDTTNLSLDKIVEYIVKLL